MDLDTCGLITKILFYSVSVYFVVCYFICSSFIYLDNSTITKQWINFKYAPYFFKYLVPSYIFYRQIGEFNVGLKSAMTSIFSTLILSGTNSYGVKELVDRLSWGIKPIKDSEIKLKFEENDNIFEVTIYCSERESLNVHSESTMVELAFIDAIIKWNKLLKNKCLI